MGEGGGVKREGEGKKNYIFHSVLSSGTFQCQTLVAM